MTTPKAFKSEHLSELLRRAQVGEDIRALEAIAERMKEPGNAALLRGVAELLMDELETPAESGPARPPALCGCPIYSGKHQGGSRVVGRCKRPSGHFGTCLESEANLCGRNYYDTLRRKNFSCIRPPGHFGGCSEYLSLCSGRSAHPHRDVPCSKAEGHSGVCCG